MNKKIKTIRNRWVRGEDGNYRLMDEYSQHGIMAEVRQTSLGKYLVHLSRHQYTMCIGGFPHGKPISLTLAKIKARESMSDPDCLFMLRVDENIRGINNPLPQESLEVGCFA